MSAAGRSDPLREIAQRLAALESAPVGEHPQALEEVHRGLVGELEALAGAAGTRGAERG